MYVYCVYLAMSKKSENLSDLNKKHRNKHHSEHQTLRLLHIFYYKISHISAIASSHFKIIDNYLYSEFFKTPQNINIICLVI
jgi:hypothetical protein